MYACPYTSSATYFALHLKSTSLGKTSTYRTVCQQRHMFCGTLFDSLKCAHPQQKPPNLEKMLRLFHFPACCCCCALITKHYPFKISSTPNGVKWRKTIHNVINAPSPRGAKHSSGNLDGLLVQITRCGNIHVRVSLPCPDYSGLHHQLEGADLYTYWSSGRSSGIISLASSG